MPNCCAQNSSEFNAYQSLSRSMLRIPKLDSLSWVVLTHWGFFVQSASFILLANFVSLMSFGVPGSRGPRFIEPPEPPVATPLVACEALVSQPPLITFVHWVRWLGSKLAYVAIMHSFTSTGALTKDGLLTAVVCHAPLSSKSDPTGISSYMPFNWTLRQYQAVIDEELS